MSPREDRMANTSEQRRYRALIERLAADAKAAPRAYRMRVALLAGVGYGVLATLLLVGLGLPLGIAAALWATGRGFDGWAVYVLLPQAVFAAMLVRALWLRFEPPRGYRLSPEEAPELANEIERLRLAAGAPALDQVVIDSDLNAGAASMPKWLGLFGHRHTLVIGLPLLRALDREELSAVLAHEFGHFRGGHGRFSAWIYRLRLSWFRFADALAGSGTFAFALLPFFRWYAPYFSAYSFVLAREDEYEADAVSARLVGEAARVSALMRVEHTAQHLKRRFFPQMQARMRSQPQPSPAYNALLAAALRETPPVDAARLLTVAARENDLEDTHPTLPQRVGAVSGDAQSVTMGATASATTSSIGAAAPTLREQGVAAIALLGESLAKIERRLDEIWREDMRAPWAAAYAAAAAERERLDAIERRGEWSVEERLEHARLVERLRPDYDATPLYRRALEAAPDRAAGWVRLGALRIDRDDPGGADDLRRAMRLDVGTIRPIFERLDAFQHDATLAPETAAAIAALREEFASQAASLIARDGVDEDDAFLAHALDETEAAALREALARIPQVGAAWLVRKRLALADEPAHFTLLVTWRGSVASEDAGLKRIVAAWPLPASVTVFGDSGQRALAKRVREACPEAIYRKGR
jgi:Zn-dependent protease with chaperone function